MQPKRITQHYWNKHQVEPPKPPDKTREDKPRENFITILKKQAKSDPITTSLSILACFLFVVAIIAQTAIAIGG